MKNLTKTQSKIASYAIITAVVLTMTLPFLWEDTELEKKEAYLQTQLETREKAEKDVWDYASKLQTWSWEIARLQTILDETVVYISEELDRYVDNEDEHEKSYIFLKNLDSQIAETRVKIKSLKWIVPKANAEEVVIEAAPYDNPFSKEETYIICGHWKSQSEKWLDNWAVFWDITERDMILELWKELKGMWFSTFWCDESKSIWEKLEYFNSERFTINPFNQKVIEIHIDKRPLGENVTRWPKILFAEQNADATEEWIEVQNLYNREFSERVCNILWAYTTCKTQNTWGLRLLNSSILPTVIIEVADPTQENFEEYKEQVLNYFKTFR